MAEVSNWVNSKHQVVTLLNSSKKLDRDSGAELFAGILSAADADVLRDAERTVIDMLSDTQLKWEAKQGSLIGARTILQVCHTSKFESTAEFDSIVMQIALRLLEDEEYAVRQSAG